MTSFRGWWNNRRRVAGLALTAGGLSVLGLWKFVGVIVPVLLLGIAIVLAWRRSAAGVAAAVVGAAVLFWFGLTFSWVFLAVGGVLTVAGVTVLAVGGAGQIEEAPKRS